MLKQRFRRLPWVKIALGVMVLALGLLVLMDIEKEGIAPVAPTEKPLQQVAVVAVEETSVTAYKTYPGKVEKQTYFVGGDRATGLVGDILVEVGDVVEKGDPLFTLDTEEALSTTRIQLKNMALSGQSLDLQIKQLEPGVLKAKTLLDEGIIAPQDYETVSHQLAQLKAQRAQVTAQYSHLNQVMTKLESKGKVVSPEKGVIKKITLTRGSAMGQGDGIELRKTGAPKCKVMVTQSDLAAYQIGKKVTVTIDGRSFDGEVTRISDREEGFELFPVSVTLMTEEVLLGGLTATVRSEVYRQDHALMVPRSSLVQFGGETYIYILGEEDRVIKRMVETGQSKGTLVEVVTGVEKSDRVVHKGQFTVAHGERVRWQ